MWIVVLTGAFGVLTLLVKAAIDVGRKQTRLRRELTLDVELLSKLREAYPGSVGEWHLEQRIDREVEAYAWLGMAPPDMSPSEQVEAATRRRARRLSLAWSNARAVGAAVATGVLLNWAVDGLAGTETTIRFDGSLPVVVATLGIASALAGFWVVSRSLRSVVELGLLQQRSGEHENSSGAAENQSSGLTEPPSR